MAENFGHSHRRACRLVNLCRGTQQYKSRKKDDGALRQRLRELAEQRRRFGSPRLHTLLRREGWEVNHKRVERLYKEEGLLIPVRKRKKRAALTRIERKAPTRVNERWSMDFVQDVLASGRRFRVLTLIDEYTRECPAVEVDTSISGARVCRVLDQLAETRGLPESIIVDNGPEFSSRALDAWAYQHGVCLDFIRPGKPVENCFVESFNGKFRYECLEEHWFTSLEEARQIIEDWRIDYNQVRPHKSLNKLTPEEFASRELNFTPPNLYCEVA